MMGGRFMKRITLAVILIAVMLCFNSCANDNKQTLDIVESDVSSLGLIKNEYKYSSVSKFLDKKPSIDQLNKKYKNGFYKRLSNLYYTVIGTEEGPIIVYFDTDMSFNNWEKISFSEDSACESLKNVNKGSSVEEVRKLDPNGSYPFLYSSWTEYPKVSYHIFENGMVYLIHYDSSSKVLGIENYTL